MNSAFDAYAAYYNALYRDKSYAEEATFVHSRVRQALTGSKSPDESKKATLRVLELGCGTGRHALEFAHRACEVVGVDLSEGMVSSAKQLAASHPTHALSFAVGDARSYRGSSPFDAVVSLFHVASYQTTTDDFSRFCETAAVNLRPGGVFAFDFWYGPGVLLDPPAVRVRRLTDDGVDILRVSEPALDLSCNRVDVAFDVRVTTRATGQSETIREIHPMRYFFQPELHDVLARAGFGEIALTHWMDDRPLADAPWYGFAVCQKRPVGV